MKMIIDNHDGMGQVDYSAYLDAEHLPKLKRKLNRAEELQAWLVSDGAGFRVPASGARVTLQRDDGFRIVEGVQRSDEWDLVHREACVPRGDCDVGVGGCGDLDFVAFGG